MASQETEVRDRVSSPRVKAAASVQRVLQHRMAIQRTAKEAALASCLLAFSARFQRSCANHQAKVEARARGRALRHARAVQTRVRQTPVPAVQFVRSRQSGVAAAAVGEQQVPAPAEAERRHLFCRRR